MDEPFKGPIHRRSTQAFESPLRSGGDAAAKAAAGGNIAVSRPVHLDKAEFRRIEVLLAVQEFMRAGLRLANYEKKRKLPLAGDVMIGGTLELRMEGGRVYVLEIKELATAPDPIVEIEMTTAPGALTFAKLREANIERAAYWHKPGSVPWTLADWSNATVGEDGEKLEAVFDLLAIACYGNVKLGLVANAIKKARRHETGVSQASGPQNLEQALKAVANEIGDVATYLDLLAHACGLRLEDCIRDTFNRVSDRENMPVRL